MRFLLVVAVMLASLLALAPVRAQGDAREAAKKHYERGIALTGAADYAGALDEFRQAYAKSPNFAVLYNVGQAEAVLGHPLEAIAALSRYLKDGGAEIPEGRRVEVEVQVARLEKSLAELTVTTDRVGAIVEVDGREIGKTPLYEPVRLASGRHVVTMVAGDRTQTSNVELAEAERRTLSLSLPEAPPPAPPAPVPPSPPRAAPVPRAPERTSASGAGTVIGYALAGTGVALGGGALAHYLWNRGRYEDWKAEHTALGDRFAPRYGARQVANNELADSITRAGRVSVTLAIAASALAASGAVLLLTAPDGKADARGVAFAWAGGRDARASAFATW